MMSDSLQCFAQNTGHAHFTLARGRQYRGCRNNAGCCKQMSENSNNYS